MKVAVFFHTKARRHKEAENKGEFPCCFVPLCLRVKTKQNAVMPLKIASYVRFWQLRCYTLVFCHFLPRNTRKARNFRVFRVFRVFRGQKQSTPFATQCSSQGLTCPSSCTISTSAITLSTGVCGVMPCPKLKMKPG